MKSGWIPWGGIKKAVKAEKDNLFVEGFVNVSLIICVGVNIAFVWPVACANSAKYRFFYRIVSIPTF